MLQNFFELARAIIAGNPYLSSLIAPVVAGELGVSTLAFLSSQGGPHLLVVYFFGSLGMIATDLFWFFLAKTKHIKKIKKWHESSSHYEAFERHVKKWFGNNPIFIFSVAKMLVGTRILVLIYLSTRHIKISSFLTAAIVANFFWAGALVLIGWIAGESFTAVFSIFRNIQIAITVLAVFILFVYIVQKWIQRKFNK